MIETVNKYWKCLLEADRISEPLPPFPEGASLRLVKRARVQTYYDLYCRVGERWKWTEKHSYSKRQWQTLLSSRHSTLIVLRVGDQDAGFFHLDFRAAPDWVILEIFGLLPDFIGMGLGKPLLGAAMMMGLHGPSACKSIRVSTCHEDHPRAMDLYSALGFCPRHTFYDSK